MTQHSGCGVSFTNWLHLIPEINSQNSLAQLVLGTKQGLNNFHFQCRLCAISAQLTWDLMSACQRKKHYNKEKITSHRLQLPESRVVYFTVRRTISDLPLRIGYEESVPRVIERVFTLRRVLVPHKKGGKT